MHEPAPPPAPEAPADRVRVILPTDSADLLDGGGTQGRMLLLFKHVEARVHGKPIDAPFFESPQPMYGVDVARLVPGEAVVFDAEAPGFPGSLSALDGRFEIQAVFDRNRTERTCDAPGNLVSEITEVDFDSEREDTVTFTLARAIPPQDLRPAVPGVIWEELRSEMLSRALHRDVIMRAGVVLPRGYHDLDWPRRAWPVVYVIPGFGGRHTLARHYAQLVAMERSLLLAPQVIWVVLDPETALGHHLFADSQRHGPRAKALVEEFIPWLESKYRIVAKPEARIVTGHSSGGWSSLWLALEHPETFGACFASAPDPVDFSAFQACDLYRDDSLFTSAEGEPRPSYRLPVGPEFERVLMTTAQETAMEHVLDPRGESGGQWDAWGSVFGRVEIGEHDVKVRRMFDPVTGAIDHDVVEREWSRYDIARRVDREWATLGPIMTGRVRLLCGDRDNFYLERAVERLGAIVRRHRKADGLDAAAAQAPGYVELVKGATHGTLPAQSMLRWNGEMREHLKRHGLD